MSSSILRVNRKIYRELYRDWYRKAKFTLRLEHTRTVFVNQHIPIGETLPSTFLAIRSLNILLYLAPNHVSVDGFRTRTHHIRALANMLSSEKARWRNCSSELLLALEPLGLSETEEARMKYWKQTCSRSKVCADCLKYPFR